MIIIIIPINNVKQQFLHDSGKRTSQMSNDRRENTSLFQRLSVLIQEFNAVAMQGTFMHTSSEATFHSSHSSIFSNFLGIKNSNHNYYKGKKQSL